MKTVSWADVQSSSGAQRTAPLLALVTVIWLGGHCADALVQNTPQADTEPILRFCGTPTPPQIVTVAVQQTLNATMTVGSVMHTPPTAQFSSDVKDR